MEIKIREFGEEQKKNKWDFSSHSLTTAYIRLKQYFDLIFGLIKNENGKRDMYVY